jgi:hypothetical protein
VRGEIEAEPRGEGRVAPARSGLPPRGASDLERSELLCGRDELEDGLLEGRPEDGRDEGREPLDGGRRDSMSLLHSEWYKMLSFNYHHRKRKGHLVKSAPFYKGCSATFYSPTRSPVQYHRRCEA